MPDGLRNSSYYLLQCCSSSSPWLVQALDPDKLKPGQRVLIHAGSGGVGHFAIQYAKLAGAYVITTASAGNHQFLKVRSLLSPVSVSACGEGWWLRLRGICGSGTRSALLL